MAERMGIDTSVLIDYEREHKAARVAVDSLIDKGVVALHPVVAAEMLEGVLNLADQRPAIKFLATFKRVAVKSSDFEH